MLHAAFEAMIREERAAIRGYLIRLTGDWDLAEDCVQEACLRAWQIWPVEGIPARPGAWVTTVARRLALDSMRRAKKLRPLTEGLSDERHEPGDLPPESISGVEDDLLRLIFTCCHPSLSHPAQVALTLRTVCDLTTREIARAFVEPEATTAQRIVRAKRKLAEDGVAFDVPPAAELPERLASVLSVIYLVFNEGYAATAGSSLLRQDLSREAIRLGRLVLRLLPKEPEIAGLLALMLLHDSRRTTRADENGDLIPLEEQDRTRWDQKRIAEGIALLDSAMALNRPGPYQIQAAIAALHAQAPKPEDTDWRQIALLYTSLLRRTPGPVPELNAAVALAMAGNAGEALRWIQTIEERGDLRDYHLLPAAKADLLRRGGQFDEALQEYERAAGMAPNEAERRYLHRRMNEIRAAR